MSRAVGVLLLAALLLGGCARVPTSGPVVQVDPSAAPHEERGVRVRPVPPRPDAAPDVVLAGFLDAMASLEPGFGVAKQYLTPRAASQWRPHAGVTVFDGDTRSSLPGSTTAGLQARVVGTLDAQGHYRASTGRMLRQDFTMQQVDGQWRISNPPQGLLVSQYTLLHRFTPTPVWFFGATGARTLVPERVWLASNPASAVEAVRALLQGPSPWLAPAVTTAIPAGTRLAVDAVAVTHGIAEVPLDGGLAGLPASRRSQVVAQLGWTLRSFPEVRAVRVLVDGEVWAVPGQRVDGSVPVDDLPGVPPIPLGGDDQPFAVVGRAVGRLDDQGSFSPLGGALGAGTWGDVPGTLAVSSSSSRMAVVNRQRTRLYTAALGRDQLVLRHAGKDLSRPVVTATGQVWVAVGDRAATALHRGGATGQLDVVPVPELAGRELVAFAVSADQTRIAVVVRSGTRTELGMVRVTPHGVDGYRSVPLQVSQMALDQVLDVGWTGPEQLMVLAAQHPGSRASAFLVSADASQVDPVGPAGDVRLQGLATRAQDEGAVAFLRADDGRVLRYESAWRWEILPHRVATMTVPS